MKIKYLGTAAAEGIPALFCHCENCKKARELGGRNIRTRSQALIDGKILIDFPCDTYFHSIRNDIDFAKIKTLLITHIHEDHFYTDDLAVRRPGFAHIDDCSPLTVYGSADILPGLEKPISMCNDENSPNKIKTVTLTPYTSVTVEDGYIVTPIEAYHSTPNPFIYTIEHDGKTILYAHDTDIPKETALEFIKTHYKHFDFVSLDCTEGNRHINYHTHMSIERNIELRDMFMSYGITDESTVFCINHFSHNGRDVLYDDMTKLAKEIGFIVSYDGMEVEI